jgi:hypothetical protein
VRARKSRAVVPPWSNLGIGFQLQHGQTFGQSLGDDVPLPPHDVLRAAWAEYRERVEAMCAPGETPWAARFDDPDAEATR